MVGEQLRDGKCHGLCPCCERTLNLTFHHLIPKKMHRRQHFKKHFTNEQLNLGIYLCRQCHNGVHRLYSEMQLAKEFNTLQRLTSDEQLSKHFSWVAKQKQVS